MSKHHEYLGHLLWELSARINALSEAELAKTELSRSALGLLDVIATSPGIAIAEIARLLPKTQQAVSQVVSRLELLGMIERRLAGARTIGLHLTPAGVRARAEGNAAEVAFERELQRAFGTERYDRLRKTLVEARPVLVEMAERRAADPTEAAPPARSKRGPSRRSR